MITELIIKLRDPNPEGVYRVEPNSRVSVEVPSGADAAYSDLDLVPFNDLVGGIPSDADGTAALRQSFPLYVAALRRRHDDCWDRRLALYFRLSIPEDVDIRAIQEALEETRMSKVVESVTRARDIQPCQGSQDYIGPSAVGGIDVRLSWDPAIEGGRGENVQICLIDKGFVLDHPFLDTPPANNPYSTNHQIAFVDGTYGPEGAHGTYCLGVLVAQKETTVGGVLQVGMITGIVPELAKCWVSSLHSTGSFKAALRAAGIDCFPNALDAPLGAEILNPGDVILIPYATKAVANEGALPVEAMKDVRDCIRAAAIEDGILVVESAGNDGINLDEHAEIISDETDLDHSSAVVVGAGYAPSSATPRSAMTDSNYGVRVDCQGWGEKVTTTIPNPANAGWFGQPMGLTSAASTIVAGVVAAVQSVNKAAGNLAIEPGTLRKLLQTTGSPQPEPGNADQHIGPLPDIRELLQHFGLLPDSFLRDSIGESASSAQGAGAITANSPDIIPRSTPLSLNEACRISNWNRDLSQPVVQGQQNWVYVRLENRGPFPDSPTVRLYCAEFDPSSSPDQSYDLIDQDFVQLDKAGSGASRGMTRGIEWTPRLGQNRVLLIAVIHSKYYKPSRGALSPSDLGYLRAHDKVAFREVQLVKGSHSLLLRWLRSWDHWFRRFWFYQ